MQLIHFEVVIESNMNMNVNKLKNKHFQSLNRIQLSSFLPCNFRFKSNINIVLRSDKFECMFRTVTSP